MPKKVPAMPLFGNKYGGRVVVGKTSPLLSPPVQHRKDDGIKPIVGKYEAGFAPKHDAHKYTGTEVVGIAVMHKSSLQPVFSQAEAEESAKMRRG